MKKKHTLLLLFFICFSFLGTSYSSDKTLNDGGTNEIEYRVCVIADRPGVTHFGGEEIFAEKLVTLFENVSAFWNKGSNRFKYKFKFTPTLHAVFDGSSQDKLQYYGLSRFDQSKYDVLVLLDMLQDHKDEHPGAAAGDQGNGICGIYVRHNNSTQFRDIFKDNTYKTLAHELGHYRMVTDIYASQVHAQNNPVNQEAFVPIPCIMFDSSRWSFWCPYAVNIINHAAESKIPLHDYPDFFRSMFPDSIQFNITKNGVPQRRINVNLYGCRAAYNDVITPAYLKRVTNAQGVVVITDVKDMYCNPPQPRPSDLPYGRWFNFLVEIVDGDKKYYDWIPEYEVQMTFFENKNIFIRNINIEDDSVNSITQIGESDVQAYVENKSIVIKGVEVNTPIYVYNSIGKLVKTMQATDKLQRIHLPAGNVYLVRTAQNLFKLSL